MLNNSKLLSLILLIPLLLSSCGTILNLKPRINIKSTVDSASVYADDKFIGLTPMLGVKLSARTKNIRVEKNGYKSFGEMKIETKSRFTPTVLNMVSGVIIVGTTIIAINGKFNGDVIYSLLGVLVPGFVPFKTIDASSGAFGKFKKSEYNFALVKKPNYSDNINSPLLSCTEFAIKINPGDRIGTLKVNNRSNSSLTWTNTNNISDKDITVFINNELNNLGYNISGLGLNKGKQNTAQLRIEVEMNKFEMDVDKTEYSGLVNQYGTVLREPVEKYNSVSIKTPIRWKLIKNNEEVVFEFVSEVNITRFSPDNLNMALFDAVQVSLYDFIAQPNFIKHTTVDSQTPDTNATYSELIIQKLTDLKGKQTDILNYCKDAVVTIESDYGTGSGFVISDEGFIVTNKHVVEKSKMVNVVFSNGFTLIGEIVRINENLDLALIKVKGSGFKPIEISRDKSQEVGTDVYAIGAPLGKQLQQTVTKGIISGQRLIDGNKYIQTDVVINQGNSGGPLINKEGKVVGMVVSKIISNGVEGIGFCIPAEVILDGLNLVYSK